MEEPFHETNPTLDCNGLDCGKAGKCVLLGNGKLTCACKNGFHNYPKCTDVSRNCTKKCPSKQKCILSGRNKKF